MATNIQTDHPDTRSWSLRKHLRRVLYAELAAIVVYGLILHFCVWR